MNTQLLIFLAALIYLSWAAARFLRRRNQKHAPFIEVLEEEQQNEEPPQVRKEEGDADQEWRRRVRAEIEDMTK